MSSRKSVENMGVSDQVEHSKQGMDQIGLWDVTRNHDAFSADLSGIKIRDFAAVSGRDITDVKAGEMTIQDIANATEKYYGKSGRRALMVQACRLNWHFEKSLEHPKDQRIAYVIEQIKNDDPSWHDFIIRSHKELRVAEGIKITQAFAGIK